MNFNSEMWGAVTAIFLAITGVAFLAVFLSKNSNTQGVIGTSFSGLATALTAAEAPVTGSTSTASFGGMGTYGSFSGAGVGGGSFI